MNDNNVHRIMPGDTVNVFWENVPVEWRCEVLYVPCATGDSWILRRQGTNGAIIYANSFSKMVRVP